jgi:hypothetical protein
MHLSHPLAVDFMYGKNCAALAQQVSVARSTHCVRCLSVELLACILLCQTSRSDMSVTNKIVVNRVYWYRYIIYFGETYESRSSFTFNF